MIQYHSFDEYKEGWKQINDDLFLHPENLQVSQRVDGLKRLIDPSKIVISGNSAEIEFNLENGIYVTRVALSDRVKFAAQHILEA